LRSEDVPTFVKSVLIDAPISAVFRFHERDDALSLLTPAFPKLRVIRRIGAIEPGARVELRIGIFSWTALHTEYEQDRLFVDEQIQGPFARWVHRHEFEDAGGGKTRLTDRVEYQLPGGPLTDVLFGWIVRQGLTSMFNHRHRVTRQVCENAKITSWP
jgi:ligand-binding SRPBCC domain-containing protein